LLPGDLGLLRKQLLRLIRPPLLDLCGDEEIRRTPAGTVLVAGVVLSASHTVF